MPTKKKDDDLDIDNLLGAGESAGASEMEEALNDSDEFEIDGVEPPENLKGNFIARCETLERTISSTDNPQLRFAFQDGDLGKRKLSTWVSLTPQSRWMVAKSLAAFGVMVNKEEKKLNFKRQDVEGRWVLLKCSERKYMGEMRQNVDIVRAATPEEIARFVVDTDV